MESDRERLIGEECGAKSESSESSSSTEEVESPRSVLMKNKVECVHSQVLRIREEDSHLGEDFLTDLERLSGKDSKTVVVGGSPTLHRVNLVVLPRPILPCSPLSGKQNIIKALH